MSGSRAELPAGTLDEVERSASTNFEPNSPSPAKDETSAGDSGVCTVKVLVYPHSMQIGGSQLVAIQLAAAVARRGHDVTVFGPAGPLQSRLSAQGVPFVEAPKAGRRPSLRIARALNDLVRAQQFDVVHGYEWPPTLEAAYGPHVRWGTPVVSTSMSMGVAPFVPKHFPVVVGTQLVLERCVDEGRTDVHLIEPCVDTDADKPQPRESQFAARWGIEDTQSLVVAVSRLAVDLKQEGLLEAMDAVAALDAGLRARLLIVGEGPARAVLDNKAASINAIAGREVVSLVGPMLDPRSAYAAADIVFGMGSSVLRAMAFAKPVIVQGEAGFWELLTPDTASMFLRQGWFGVGSGDSGTARLTGLLSRLLDSERERARLGDFARELVEQRFSSSRAAALQEAIYADAMSRAVTTGRVYALARSFTAFAAYELRRRARQMAGRGPVADFNARDTQPAPVAVDSR